MVQEPKQSSFAHLPPKNHAEIYSFANRPRDPSLPVDESSDPKRAYKGFVTSSRRQGGVYSTLDVKYQYLLSFVAASLVPRCTLPLESVLSMAHSLPTTVAPITSTSYVNISGSPAISNGCITRGTSEFSDGSMTCIAEEDELSFKSRAVETYSLADILASFRTSST
ncbi:hypothetical protein BDM02DRAFT_3192782 [Thelephora ganbajun]|uniref:Uncharacterized protein n=1 Tax=Thelephora ganbajun TaxID=370292 RepID=A0ACB6YZS3_THEGA|nr:hypothetical protein BDM02DRAFT_3192782 [Thelephora ganbajun]